jgi:Reverse transcriptase (RNA-dependent DNA polymerase)
MIYEFLSMTEDDLTSAAYNYTHVLRADIRNFYPSIYTHSISWAIHGKGHVRKGNNRHDLSLLGNRLDKLFQYANDQKTNGIPIGPVVSDIVAEIIAASVDQELTRGIRADNIECEMTRFKDDYRILVNGESDGWKIMKHLQHALKKFDLTLADDKCSIHELPEGLFRPWVSAYHAAYSKKRSYLRWKEFRELYLAVLRIDEQFPGTGVIDRFLADIISGQGGLKVKLTTRSLEKAMSMLLMLGNRRAKSFPKILGIIESILHSPIGREQTSKIASYLDNCLKRLSKDEAKNLYLISWLVYFLISNGMKNSLSFTPKYKNVIVRSVFNNRGLIFRDDNDFRLFEGSRTMGKAHSMLEYLDVFNPPRPT